MLQALWARGAHVLAAVSGGCDSVALLLMLQEAAERGELRLSAAHFEHGIRGADSDQDARFVEALCRRLDVPLHLRHQDVPALARERGIGLEQAARDARYAFLREVKAGAQADVIALGHHADDQAETVLMHLMRGAGLRGAGGMRPVQGDLVRPLLHITKAELMDELGRRGQEYRTDRTNFEPDGPRNRLRLSVMPRLTAVYPGAVPALCRYAVIADEENRFMDGRAREWLGAHMQALPMGVRFEVCMGAAPALVRRALAMLLPDPGYAELRRLTELYFEDAGRLALQGGYEAERAGKFLYLLNPGKAPPEGTRMRDGANLAGIGTIRVRFTEPAPIRDDPWRQALNRAALEGAVFRTRRPGDRFRMLGAPGDRLLSDVLTDRKIDRPLRDYLPLIAVGERVLWVPGLGIAEQAKLTGGDDRAILLVYEGERLI